MENPADRERALGSLLYDLDDGRIWIGRNVFEHAIEGSHG